MRWASRPLILSLWQKEQSGWQSSFTASTPPVAESCKRLPGAFPIELMADFLLLSDDAVPKCYCHGATSAQPCFHETVWYSKHAGWATNACTRQERSAVLVSQMLQNTIAQRPQAVQRLSHCIRTQTRRASSTSQVQADCPLCRS